MIPLYMSLELEPEAAPIVNGDRTSEYEEVVLLYMTDRNGYQAATCTGSLIAPRWILTAAHCITDSDGFTIKHVYAAWVSEMNDVSERNTVEAVEWYPHPDYNSRNGEYDIALVELDEDHEGPFMQLSDSALKRSETGEEFRLVGFGATSDSDSNSNAKKREADVPLYDFDAVVMFTYDEDDGQNACYGDSGGPTLRLYENGDYAQAGVMDYVSSCVGGGLGSARVDQLMDFINEYTTDYTIYGEVDVVPDPEPEAEDSGIADQDAEDAPGLVSDSGVVRASASCSTTLPTGWLGLSAAAAVLLAARRRLGRFAR